MKLSARYPEGFQIPAGAKVVSRHLPGGEIAVKVFSEYPEHKFLYLVCTPEWVSKGILLTLEEVGERLGAS